MPVCCAGWVVGPGAAGGLSPPGLVQSQASGQAGGQAPGGLPPPVMVQSKAGGQALPQLPGTSLGETEKNTIRFSYISHRKSHSYYSHQHKCNPSNNPKLNHQHKLSHWYKFIHQHKPSAQLIH